MNDKMSFNENLLKYARLIVKAGVNVQKGQIVVIDAPVENAKLARMITKDQGEMTIVGFLPFVNVGDSLTVYRRICNS